ncbi:MAG: cytochrome C oxidase Cbb3, partial [Corallincola sp.]|nr:cytochrome C oxidase Cbb3 [Corallincola sp.]
QAVGAPNLTDDIWLYGGSRRAVEETLRHGRAGVMPPWQQILGDDKIHLLTAYVYSLSNEPAP